MTDLTSNIPTLLEPDVNPADAFASSAIEAMLLPRQEEAPIANNLAQAYRPSTPREIVQARIDIFFGNLQGAIEHLQEAIERIETAIRNPREGLTAIADQVTQVSDNCSLTNVQNVTVRIREMRDELADLRQGAVDRMAANIETARQLGRRSCFFRFMSTPDVAEDARPLIENGPRGVS